MLFLRSQSALCDFYNKFAEKSLFVSYKRIIIICYTFEGGLNGE